MQVERSQEAGRAEARAGEVRASGDRAFAEALRRARSPGPGRERSEGAGPGHPVGARGSQAAGAARRGGAAQGAGGRWPQAGRDEGGPGAEVGDAGDAGEGRGAPGRPVGARGAARRAPREAGASGEERPVAPEAAGAGPAEHAPAPLSTPELAAAARALPVAVAAARARHGAPLSLTFGRSLAVELRAAPGGVALRLLSDARLGPAARAELPALLAALRRRGVAVVEAKVMVRGNPGDRVDGGAPLR